MAGVGGGAAADAPPAWQEVMVDHKVKLIDCPGIIFDDGAADSRTVVLRNCVSVQSMEDAEGAVEAIVQVRAARALAATSAAAAT